MSFGWRRIQYTLFYTVKLNGSTSLPINIIIFRYNFEMLEEEEESRKIICLNNQQIFPSVLDSPNRGVSSSSALWPPCVSRQGLKRSPTNDETTGEMNLTTTMNIIPKMTIRISENVNIQKVRQTQRLIIIFWGCVQYSGKEAEAFAMNPIHRSSSSRDLLFYHLSVSLPGWKMGRL